MDPEKVARAKALRAKALRAKAAAAGQVQQQPVMQAPIQQQEESGDFWDTAADVGVSGLKLAGRVLDYPGGLGRVAYKGLVNIPYALRTGQSLTKEDDVLRALKGEAPTSEEYMIREGYEPGAATTIAGIAQDIALDPTTYMTFGATGLKKAAEGLGKMSYKSGLKALDQEALKYGKKPVSDLLLKQGFAGSAEQGQKYIDDLAKELLKTRDSILAEATRKGAEVDVNRAMAPLLSKIDEVKKTKDPNLIRAAQLAQKQADEYLKMAAKEPEQIVRPLYQKADYVPGRTEIDVIPGEYRQIDLPVQSKFVPGYSEVQSIPAQYKQIDLPVQSAYAPPYRELPIDKSSSLPLGNVSPQPYKTVAETKYQRSKPALAKMRGPYNSEFKDIIRSPEMDVQIGQLMPERFTPRAPVVGYAEEPAKVIAGKTTPDKFIQNAPVSGYVDEPGKIIRGKTVQEQFIPKEPQWVLDMTERVGGPSPKKVSGWKSSTYKGIGSPGYEKLKSTPIGKQFEKVKAAGLKQAIEESIEKSLGTGSKEQLIELNEKLGQLLTTNKKAAKEAAKEINKNTVTSVDGIMTGVLAATTGDAKTIAKALAAKKLTDFAKTQKARTVVGKALVDRSKTGMQLERNLLTSPWLTIKRSNQNEGE